MKFRGLHPRTQLVRWGLVAVAIGIILGATAPTAASQLHTVWEANRSSLPWVFERLFAFLAYFAMAGSVVYGLLLSTKILDAIAHRPITFTLHQDLAAIGLGLAGIHGVLLGLDHSMPFTLAQIAVPGLAPYAPLWVAAGQVSFYLMAVVIGSFYARRRIGQRAWRTLHYVTFLAFVGATAHGLAAGTDSGSAWAWWTYVGSSTAVAFLLAYRIAVSVMAHSGRAGAARPSSGPRSLAPRSAGIDRDVEGSAA
jgi:methionine sulfoxide reductase heme-binding subunit